MTPVSDTSRRALLRASLAGAALAASPAFAAAAPVAETRYGKVRGYVKNGIKCFKGIR